jgi:hypothetical protein|tara:strand:+ start:216 stop:1034 length:819 start_codon:yes stop_codon:yes gene_type:complete
MIGAKVAKNTIINRSQFSTNDVVILSESEIPSFKRFFMKPYLRWGKMVEFNKNDMQSFTLLRFHIPFLMGFHGKALVIDPDIFQVQEGIEGLINFDFERHSIYARKGLQKNSWASSAMLISCENFLHWSLENFINQLHLGEIDYDDLINLRLEKESIGELDKKWNEFDQINLNTILLHTTEKITQPWRAGLSLNSTIPPLFKYIPRAPIYKLFGKDLTKGREHPHQAVTDFFFKELALCLSENIISSQELDDAMQKKFMRPDIHNKLKHISR